MPGVCVAQPVDVVERAAGESVAVRFGAGVESSGVECARVEWCAGVVAGRGAG